MTEARLGRLRSLTEHRKLDAVLVTEIANIFYLTGFTGSTAALVVTADTCDILVDPRYTLQAASECPSARVVGYSGKSALDAVSGHLAALAPGTVGYEADNLTVASFRKLRNSTGEPLRLRATAGLVQGLRKTKDAHEVGLIREAVRIADETFSSLLGLVRPGMTEKEVALLVDSTVRRLGGDKEAFDTIAACGPNSACPHAQPTDAVLNAGQLLKLDFGARYRHYNSDLTRTVCLGKPDAKQREVYQIVLDAQLKAINAIGPGKPGREVDAVAREFIASHGYGDNFGHGLGHALGIDVHDGPALSQTSDVVLEPGMVVTVEPGIYIEGWGGVRIEDDVVVTDTGAEILTGATKEFLSI